MQHDPQADIEICFKSTFAELPVQREEIDLLWSALSTCWQELLDEETSLESLEQKTDNMDETVPFH